MLSFDSSGSNNVEYFICKEHTVYIYLYQRVIDNVNGRCERGCNKQGFDLPILPYFPRAIITLQVVQNDLLWEPWGVIPNCHPSSVGIGRTSVYAYTYNHLLIFFYDFEIIYLSNCIVNIPCWFFFISYKNSWP